MQIMENMSTLRDVYNGDFPDSDELFWDYVRQSDIDTPLAVRQLPAYKLKITLLSQYRVEHIDEILDMIDDDRNYLITKYQNDPSLSNEIIVLCDGRIIDGNHRALAATLSNKSIKCIDLSDLDSGDMSVN